VTDLKSLKQASARGVVWNIAQNLAGRLLSLIVVAILGRILDRSAFGVIAFSLVVNSFAELIVNQGFGEFITQRPALTDDYLDTAFWFNLGIGIALTLMIALTATPLADAFADVSIAPIVRIVSVTLVFRSISVVPYSLLVRRMQFRSLSVRSIIATAFSGVAGIICALAGLGIYSLVVQVVLADLASTVVLWRATEWRPKRVFSRKCLREMSTFGAPVFASSLLGLVSRRLDTLIVAGALDMARLGIYSMAQRVFQIVMQVLNKSMSDVAFSALSRVTDVDARRDALVKVVELTAVLCFPVYIGIAIVAQPLMVTIVGAKWSVSAWPLSLFALSGIPFSLTLINLPAITSSARTRFLLVIQVIFLAVYMPAIVLLVGRGPTEAALANLIACTAIAPVEIWFVAVAMPMRALDYVKALIGPSAATGVMALAALGVASVTTTLPPIVRIGVEAIAAIPVYVVALRVLAPVAFDRCIKLIASTLRRKPKPEAA
jgi:O-antigen/teichoic acid export membrane protein